jgi:hypothetical protein
MCIRDRATPLGPVIDQNRTIGLEHVLLEAAVADIVDVFAHGVSPGSKSEVTPS